MRISDWSSDVCSSDLGAIGRQRLLTAIMDVKAVGIESVDAGNLYVIDSGKAVVIQAFDFGHESLTIGLAAKAGQQRAQAQGLEIGRASCRERVWQYV